MSQRRFLFYFPWVILAAALMLTAVGLLGIYSATFSDARHGDEAARQVTWLLLSLCVLVVAVWPSYTRLARLSYPLYAVALFLLCVLLAARYVPAPGVPGGRGIPGLVEPRNWAFSWFQVPGTRIAVQPSELAKIAFVMALARYLTYRKNYRRLRGLVAPFLMALLPTALVVKQPDLGTALMFMPVLLLMLLAAGARVKHLLAVVVAVALFAPVFYLKLDGFQQRRLDQWLLAGPFEEFHTRHQRAARANARLSPQEQRDMVERLRGSLRVRLFLLADKVKWWNGRHLPWLFGSKSLRERGYYDAPYANELDPDPQTPDEPMEAQYARVRQFVRDWLKGFGYHSWQAKIAVGSGGLTGAGMCRGIQTQHGFLAEAHSDFIYAAVAEEWGFVGALIVLALYVVIIVFGVDVGLSTNEPYGKLLAVGVVAMITVQAFLHMAITVGLTPVTGIPLPLVSYGGSSLVSSYLAVGLLCNVGMRRYVLPEPGPFRFDD